jgi:hypothetical protein
MRIDANAILNVETCFGRQLCVGEDANADHDNIRWQGPTVCCLHSLDLAVPAKDLANALMKVEHVPPRSVGLREVTGRGFGYGSGHRSVSQLKHLNT